MRHGVKVIHMFGIFATEVYAHNILKNKECIKNGFERRISNFDCNLNISSAQHFLKNAKFSTFFLKSKTSK